MKRKLLCALLCCAGMWNLSAQVEVLTPEATASWLKEYQAASSAQGPFRDLMKQLAKAPEQQKITAARVAKDFPDLKDGSGVLLYSVPAMSETQYLPHVYPFDGEAGRSLRIIAAGDEYEPGSFLLYALQDFGKVQFEVRDLKSEDGNVFPKDRLDLKTIKVWYQNGNGWYSYFQDTGLKLCPELLLNDEDLIKVDTKKKANYARLTEKDGAVSYYWLTPIRDVDNRIEDAPGYRLDEAFCCMKPNFRDAAAFQGAALNAGEFKQFFLTAHVQKDQKPGLYTGSIELKKDGKTIGSVPVELRVLPFVLPKPKTYYDPGKDFLVFMCEYVGLEFVRQINGNDYELAEKQLISLLKNFARHNETTPNYREAWTRPDINKAAGLDESAYPTLGMLLGQPVDMRYDARRKKEAHIKRFGTNKNHILGWGDEYGLSTLKAIRPMLDIYKGEGFKIHSNSRHAYAAAAYLADIYWPPVWPDSSENITPRLTSKMHFLGGDAHVGWYAAQHVGVENPAFIRRQFGFGAYRAGISVHWNYAHHLNGYNDIRGNTYKSMNFVYGSGDGVIDTLSWEAFREGMDDICYATLLQLKARALLSSEDLRTRYAAKKALQYLADMNNDDFDVTTARMEIIRHIMTLQSLSK